MLSKASNSAIIKPSQALLVAAFCYLLLFLSVQILWYLATFLPISDKSPWLFLILTTLSLVLTYLYCLYLTENYCKRFFRQLFKIELRWTFLALAGGVSLALTAHYANQYWQIDQVSSQAPLQPLMFLFNSGTAVAIASLILFVIIAPILEEYLFRGVIFDSFNSAFGLWASVAISSVAFTSFHLLDYFDYPHALLAIFLLAVLLAILRYKSQSITHSIICHASYNLTIIGAGIFL